MLLEEWLIKENVRPYMLSKALGLSASTLYRGLDRSQRLSAKVCVMIEEYTKKEVTRSEALWPEAYDGKGRAPYISPLSNKK